MTYPDGFAFGSMAFACFILGIRVGFLYWEAKAARASSCPICGFPRLSKWKYCRKCGGENPPRKPPFV